MRARQRHVNARHAGAVLVLDARYINQSDSTAVSTWSDRSGNAYDFSQATGANQPLFRTAGNGGSPAVQFDGTNDKLTRADTGFPQGAITYIAVSIQSTALAFQEYRSTFGYGVAAGGQAIWIGYGEDGNWGTEAFGTSQYGNGVGISNATQAYIVASYTRSTGNTYALWLNGGTKTTKPIGTNTQIYGANGAAVGANGLGPTNAGYPAYLNGYIGTIIYAGSEWSDSLRRKFESSLAYSWKITCS